MAKYIIDSETLEGLANTIRNLTGETRKYTPLEMIDAVSHIMDSPVYIILDQDDNEHYALYTGEDIVLTATADDIPAGKIAITGSGVTVGTGVEEYDGTVIIT